MARQRGNRDRQMTTRVAQEAARLIHDEGMRDYGDARRKAARRLQVRDDAVLPEFHEIERALREHIALFGGAAQPQRLRELRETAIEAMRFLEAFEPRLVGAVLDGTTDAHTAVSLHLFADDVDRVGHALEELGIRYDRRDRRLRFDARREVIAPVYLFIAGDVPMDLTVLPESTLRQAPLDRDGLHPVARASLAQLRTLLTLDGEPPPAL
jgi:DNA-binding transcriptional ArsR family regulator